MRIPAIPRFLQSTMVFLGCALFAFSPEQGWGESSDQLLQQADSKFEKKLYQDALQDYAALLRSGAALEVRLKALYRAIESEVLQFRYLEGAQRLSGAARLIDEGADASPLWRARFLILRAELGREYLKQYGSVAPEDAETNATDLSRRTPAEWHSEILSLIHI